MSEQDHSEEWGDQPVIRFFPDHFISEGTAMILVMAAYTVLAIFLPAHLDIKSNPAITPEGSKPEWYFLFLFALLHYVSPLVGTVLPVIGLAFLALLPWIDRNPAKAPRKRPIAMAACAAIIVGILYLSYLGWAPA
jgi:ubiquinol-cytochrome c reductase cytochrome b subunit